MHVIRAASRAVLLIGLASLAGCRPPQQHLRPSDVRPLHYTNEKPAPPVYGLRRAVEAARARHIAVRLLTVHGMRTNNVGFSMPWQEAIGKRLGLVRRDSVEEGKIPRGFNVTVFAGVESWRSVTAEQSVLRVTRWADAADTTTDRLVVYELTWAPMRDLIKRRYLACFESRSVPSAHGSEPDSARPNPDRGAGINGALKDGLLVDGFADASIVLSPLANVLLNAAFGWWWADPLAALAMTPIIAKEGIEGIRGESECADCCT